MRCCHCGDYIQHDPIIEDGEIYCSLECREAGMLDADQYLSDDEPELELEGLFGDFDDDDY